MDIKEIRKKYPQYENVDDLTLAKGLHSKYYPDMDFEDFSNRIGISQTPDNTLEKISGGASSLDKGLTYGFGKKIGGLINAIGATPVDITMGKPAGESFKKRYEEIVKNASSDENLLKQENPNTALALELGGSLLNPVNKAGANYLLKSSNLGKGIAKGV